MSGVMMLNHLAETRDDAVCAAAAQRIKDGYNRALAEGGKTRDLGGRLGTSEFADAIVRHLDG
jgi:isocitrate/isopropylmalate dehydrogenase